MGDSEKSWWEQNVEDPYWAQKDAERALYADNSVARLNHDINTGIEKGIYYGAKDMAVGLFEVAKWAALMYVGDPETEKATGEAVVHLAKAAWPLAQDLFMAEFGTWDQKQDVFNRWSKTVGALGNALADKVKKDWAKASEQGKEAELVSQWASRGAFEIASLFVGAGELGAAAKTAKGAEAVSALSKVEKAGALAAECESVAAALQDASDVEKAFWALDQAAATKKAEDTALLLRPTWRQSEVDVGKILGGDFVEQQSFKNVGGKPQKVPYGTKGSTRPDWFKAGPPPASVEVKNYNLETVAGQRRLIDNVTNQAIQRAKEMPADTVQHLIIDVRGQNVPLETLDDIVETIEHASNGNLKAENIRILR